MRQMVLNHNELFGQLEELRKSVSGQDDQIKLIFEYLKQFEQSKQQELNQQNRNRIGYKREDEE